MASSVLNAENLDALQRIGFIPQSLTPDAALTAAQIDARRLFHIRGVGRLLKAATATNPDRLAHVPSESLLIGLHGYDIPFAFLIQGSPTGVAFHFGIWSHRQTNTVTSDNAALDRNAKVLQSTLGSVYITVEQYQIVKPELIRSSHSGFVLGVPTLRPSDPLDDVLPVDRLTRALVGMNWSCLVLAKPVKEPNTTPLRREVINRIREVEEEVQTIGRPSRLAKQYTDLLEAALVNLTRGQAEGVWRTAVYLLGDSVSYPALVSAWRSIFSGTESVIEPVNVHDSADASRLAVLWAMPDIPGDRFHPYQYQTLLTSSQLATYAHLPKTETSGFAVQSVPAFDVVPALRDASQTAAIGHIMANGTRTKTEYRLAPEAFTRHTFVAGVTGAGKTNTVMVLLKEARRTARIPFLVIEPAKTEYRELLNDNELNKELQIFTLGNETVAPFRLNPFEVPKQIPIGVHIDLLRSVFSASFGLWAPLPQILERCLYQIYEDRGWDITTNTNHRGETSSAAFPTLTELTAEVERYISSLGYTGEVVSNMRAALPTRINSLRIGGKGRMLDVRKSLPIETLIKLPTIIELESMGDDDDKAFVMGLLFIRLVEYWRTLGKAPNGETRHLLVIEEAHRLLSNVANTGRVEDASPRAKAVETFANILSEVRAYGQGIIIVDQVPVKLARDVIKNTNLKIAHRIVDAEDRQVLAGSMAMTEEQTMYLAVLPKGRAAVFSEGDDEPLLVEIPPAKDSTQSNTDKSSPDNARVKSHMSRSTLFQEYGPLYRLHPSLSGVSEGSAHDEYVARLLAESPVLQRTFSRVIASTLIDAGAPRRLWRDLQLLIDVDRPAMVEPARFVACVLYYATEVYTERLGTQAGWSFNMCEELKNLIQHLFFSDMASKPDDYQKLREALLSRFYTFTEPPYPLCDQLCRKADHHYTCPFRFAAAGLVSSKQFSADWQRACAADRNAKEDAGEAVFTYRWFVCQDGGYECAEFISDVNEREPLPPEALQVIQRAAQQACLCFGQQLILQENRMEHPRYIVEELNRLMNMREQ